MKSRRIPLAVKPVEPPVLIEITMSESEAVTLFAITQRVGGLPHNTRRKHTDALGRALQSAGIDLPENNNGECATHDWISKDQRSIHFLADSLPEEERTEQ